MYSNEDIREIIQSLMTEYTISSESVISKTPVETVQQNMGNQIILDVGDDVSDLRSVIEIYQRKFQDTIKEYRRVTIKVGGSPSRNTRSPRRINHRWLSD